MGRAGAALVALFWLTGYARLIRTTRGCEARVVATRDWLPRPCEVLYAVDGVGLMLLLGGVFWLALSALIEVDFATGRVGAGAGLGLCLTGSEEHITNMSMRSCM